MRKTRYEMVDRATGKIMGWTEKDRDAAYSLAVRVMRENPTKSFIMFCGPRDACFNRLWCFPPSNLYGQTLT